MVKVDKKILLLYTTISMMVVLSFIVFGHYLSDVLSNIVLNESINQNKIIYIALFFMFYITLTFIYQFLSGTIANKNIKHLSQQVLNSIDHRSKAQSEEVMNAMFYHMEKYRPYEKVFVPTIIMTIVKFIGIIVATAFVHLNAAIIMIVTAPFVPLFYILVGLNTEKEAKQQASKFDEMGTFFLNLVRGKDSIRYFNANKNTLEQLKMSNINYVTETMRILKYAFQSTLMLEFITILGIGLIALEVGLQIIIFKGITFYEAFFTLLLAPMFYNQLKVMGVEFHNGKIAIGHKEQIDELITAHQPIKEYRTVNNNSLLHLNQITLSYGNNHILENITLNITDPGLIAITGKSGAGKSTLLRSIIGLHPPSDGEVSVCSTDIGYLSDDIYFSDISIYEYISNNRYNETEVINILEQLKMMDTMNNLKHGIHTLIENHNIPLSGGEIVRLKLAKILIDPPKVILMDEPTEFLDSLTEQLLMNYLNDLKQSSLIIAVIHRKKLLQIADRHFEISPYTRQMSEVMQ